MKNRTVALMLISALVLSSISLAMSLAAKFTTEVQRPGAIPPQAFEGLGGKTGVGFGDWKVDATYPNLTIFSYPAGANSTGSGPDYPPAGWNAYLVDMLITATVTFDTADAAGQGVNVTFYYLEPYPIPPGMPYEQWKSTNMTVTLSVNPQSTTFTGQIYKVTVSYVGPPGYAGGHYFVSADRRV